MHSHFSGYVGGNDMAVFQFHAEHRVGKGLDYFAVLLYRWLFCHN
jgi:hypothetical protein